MRRRCWMTGPGVLQPRLSCRCARRPMLMCTPATYGTLAQAEQGNRPPLPALQGGAAAFAAGLHRRIKAGDLGGGSHPPGRQGPGCTALLLRIWRRRRHRQRRLCEQRVQPFFLTLRQADCAISRQAHTLRPHHHPPRQVWLQPARQYPALPGTPRGAACKPPVLPC